MVLHIAQLQECKVCSLFCSIHEEKSCLGFLHLWRRDQSPVSTAVWFVGSHKIIRVESSQGSLFPSSLPSVQSLTRRFSLDSDPQYLGGGSMQKWWESPTYFLLYEDWNFPLLTHSTDFQHFATMTEKSIFWELTHALYKHFFQIISYYFLSTPRNVNTWEPQRNDGEFQTRMQIIIYSDALYHCSAGDAQKHANRTLQLCPWISSLMISCFKMLFNKRYYSVNHTVYINTENWISACILGEFLGCFWNSPWLHLDLLFRLFISTILLCGNNNYMAVCYCSWQLSVYFWE